MSRSAGKTGLVIVTHGTIGRSLIEVAEFILGKSLADIGFVSFRQSELQETSDAEIEQALEIANRGQGVLVLTDVGGASPHNHVASLLPRSGISLLSGLNLAMLIRAWNYRQHPPEELKKLAARGAIREIGSTETARRMDSAHD